MRQPDLELQTVEGEGAAVASSMVTVASSSSTSGAGPGPAPVPHPARPHPARPHPARPASSGTASTPLRPSSSSSCANGGVEVATRETVPGSRSSRTGERMCDLLYEAQMGPFDPILDYAGVVIQYGYVVYFSVTWPMAPLVCALHTAFRLRSNVLRLTKCSMRPQAEATASIGLWETLLSFECHSGVLINCLLVTISTDQLDHLSCWAHSLFGDSGGCSVERGGEVSGVPMTARFLIAVVAEHLILGVIFVLNAAVPDRDEAFKVRLKKAAFQFKRRYLAEAMMMDDAAGGVANVTTNSSSRVGTAAAGALASPFGGVSSVDYDAAWRSGSELSDAYESDDAAGPPAREMESHAGGGLAGSGGMGASVGLARAM